MDMLLEAAAQAAAPVATTLWQAETMPSQLQGAGACVCNTLQHVTRACSVSLRRRGEPVAPSHAAGEAAGARACPLGPARLARLFLHMQHEMR